MLSLNATEGINSFTPIGRSLSLEKFGSTNQSFDTMKFLDRLAHQILAKKVAAQNLYVILPSERAKRYLQNSLFQMNQGPLISTAYRDWETDRKSTRLNSSHLKLSRMPSSA